LRALVACGALALVAGCAHDDRAAKTVAQSSQALESQPPSGIANGAAPVATGVASPAPSTSPEAPPGSVSAAAGPQILAVTQSSAVVHAGESVAFSAKTSPDVATVTAKVSAYSLPFVRTAPGRFALSFAIPPNVPGMFHGTYSMSIVASEKDGASVSRSIEITFQ
jgi:glucose/arabinose dehydrogenase